MKAGGLEVRNVGLIRSGWETPVKSVVVCEDFASTSPPHRMKERLQSWCCLGRDEERAAMSTVRWHSERK